MVWADSYLTWPAGKGGPEAGKDNSKNNPAACRFLHGLIAEDGWNKIR
jgi:hypothetical protein